MKTKLTVLIENVKTL